MFTVKAYKNVTKFSEEANDLYEEEVLALELDKVVGHAFGTFTFTLLKEGGACVIYRYDLFDRIEVTPVEVAAEVSPDSLDNVVAIH